MQEAANQAAKYLNCEKYAFVDNKQLLLITAKMQFNQCK